jgi:hypothetical protein
VDRDQVLDTQLMHRLLVLGQHGNTANTPSESSLRCCTKTYLKIDMPEGVKDSDGDTVDLTSFGKWLNRKPSGIQPVYLESVAQASVATFLIHRKVEELTSQLLLGSSNVWGYRSAAHLCDQIQRHGPQTHHIQLKAAIALTSITANGLRLDVERRDELQQHLEVSLQQQKEILRSFGYIPADVGSQRSLQAVLRLRSRQNPGLQYPRSAVRHRL